jgi:hypothetical protein
MDFEQLDPNRREWDTKKGKRAPERLRSSDVTWSGGHVSVSVTPYAFNEVFSPLQLIGAQAHRPREPVLGTQVLRVEPSSIWGDARENQRYLHGEKQT